MGLGGPLGGFISDRFEELPFLLTTYIINSLSRMSRFGWRWAFLIQIPLFIVSFLLTGYNLRYVTPVSTRQ